MVRFEESGGVYAGDALWALGMRSSMNHSMERRNEPEANREQSTVQPKENGRLEM